MQKANKTAMAIKSLQDLLRVHKFNARVPQTFSLDAQLSILQERYNKLKQKEAYRKVFSRFETSNKRIHYSKHYRNQRLLRRLEIGLMEHNFDEVVIAWEMGAPTNYMTRRGDTPITVAVKAQAHEHIPLAIKLNCDIEQKDHNGCTPLCLAAMLNDEMTVNILLDAGAIVDKFSTLGVTGETISPLMVAVSKGREAVSLVVRLLQAGANVNLCDSRGRSPLMYACRFRSYTLVNLLLEEGANPAHVDKSGFSCLEWVRAAAVERNSTQRQFPEQRDKAVSLDTVEWQIIELLKKSIENALVCSEVDQNGFGDIPKLFEQGHSSYEVFEQIKDKIAESHDSEESALKAWDTTSRSLTKKVKGINFALAAEAFRESGKNAKKTGTPGSTPGIATNVLDLESIAPKGDNGSAKKVDPASLEKSNTGNEQLSKIPRAGGVDTLLAHGSENVLDLIVPEPETWSNTLEKLSSSISLSHVNNWLGRKDRNTKEETLSFAALFLASHSSALVRQHAARQLELGRIQRLERKYDPMLFAHGLERLRESRAREFSKRKRRALRRLRIETSGQICAADGETQDSGVDTLKHTTENKFDREKENVLGHLAADLSFGDFINQQFGIKCARYSVAGEIDSDEEDAYTVSISQRCSYNKDEEARFMDLNTHEKLGVRSVLYLSQKKSHQHHLFKPLLPKTFHEGMFMMRAKLRIQEETAKARAEAPVESKTEQEHEGKLARGLTVEGARELLVDLKLKRNSEFSESTFKQNPTGIPALENVRDSRRRKHRRQVQMDNEVSCHPSVFSKSTTRGKPSGAPLKPSGVKLLREGSSVWKDVIAQRSKHSAQPIFREKDTKAEYDDNKHAIVNSTESPTGQNSLSIPLAMLQSRQAISQNVAAGASAQLPNFSDAQSIPKHRQAVLDVEKQRNDFTSPSVNDMLPPLTTTENTRSPIIKKSSETLTEKIVGFKQAAAEIGGTFRNRAAERKAKWLYENSLEERKVMDKQLANDILGTKKTEFYSKLADLELATIQMQRQKYDEAEEILNNVIQLQRENLPRHHRSMAATHELFGRLYLYRGEYGKAVEYIRETIDTLKKHKESVLTEEFFDLHMLLLEALKKNNETIAVGDELLKLKIEHKNAMNAEELQPASEQIVTKATMIKQESTIAAALEAAFQEINREQMKNEDEWYLQRCKKAQQKLSRRIQRARDVIEYTEVWKTYQRALYGRYYDDRLWEVIEDDYQYKTPEELDRCTAVSVSATLQHLSENPERFGAYANVDSDDSDDDQLDGNNYRFLKMNPSTFELENLLNVPRWRSLLISFSKPFGIEKEFMFLASVNALKSISVDRISRATESEVRKVRSVAVDKAGEIYSSFIERSSWLHVIPVNLRQKVCEAVSRVPFNMEPLQRCYDLVFHQTFEPVFQGQFWKSRIGNRYKLERTLALMMPQWPLSRIAKLSSDNTLLRKITTIQKLVRGHLFRTSHVSDVNMICSGLAERDMLTFQFYVDKAREARENYRAKELTTKKPKTSKKKNKRSRRSSTGGTAWIPGINEVRNLHNNHDRPTLESPQYDEGLNGYEGIDEYGFPWRSDDHGYPVYLDASGTEFYMQEDGYSYFFDVEGNPTYFFPHPPSAYGHEWSANSDAEYDYTDANGDGFVDHGETEGFRDSHQLDDVYSVDDMGSKSLEYSGLPISYEPPSPFGESNYNTLGTVESDEAAYMFDEEQAAIGIQRCVRGHFARQYVRQLLLYTYSCHYDDYSGQYYFVDNYTGESSWYPPSVLSVPWEAIQLE